MRNLVSFAVASLLLLPAFGARADGPASGEEAGPRSPTGEESPDRAPRAVPTVDITFARIGDLDADFTVQFEWSEPVNGFSRSDIKFTGASSKTQLTVVQADSIWTIQVDTDSIEGMITATVMAGAVTSKSTDEENVKTTGSRKVDNKRPELLTATANEFKIVLTYHEEVDDNPTGDPPLGDFIVNIFKFNGEERKKPATLSGPAPLSRTVGFWG